MSAAMLPIFSAAWYVKTDGKVFLSDTFERLNETFPQRIFSTNTIAKAHDRRQPCRGLFYSLRGVNNGRPCVHFIKVEF